MPRAYQFDNIRALLNQAFTTEDLIGFCYDLPYFAAVYGQFSPQTGKAEAMSFLLTVARRDGWLDRLLDLLRERDGGAYERHRPYFKYLDTAPLSPIRPETQNPFNYGNAIGETFRFIGRRREIEQVQSRLLNAEFESSAIVGERRIGKTSLLKYLAHDEIAHRAGFVPERYIFVYSDLQLFGPNRTPTDFWRRVLRDTKRLTTAAALQNLIDEVSHEKTIDTFLLDDLFTLVDDLDLHIILLLDEFERVTQNENFDVDFFSGLRAMAIHHNLALVTSSRRELIDLTHSKEVQDSPFFNIFATVNLRLFSDDDVNALLRNYLSNNRIHFSQAEAAYLLRLAGPHPYFFQMACYTLYEAYAKAPDWPARQRLLETDFREEAAPMFSTYWYHAPPDQRVLLIILALRRLSRGTATDQGDTLSQLKLFYEGAERTLMTLEKRGLVMELETASGQYTLFSQAFCDWLAEELLSKSGDAAVWIDWQRTQVNRLNQLPLYARQQVLDLIPNFNSAQIDSLGEWLLDRVTVSRAVLLLKDFLDRMRPAARGQERAGAAEKTRTATEPSLRSTSTVVSSDHRLYQLSQQLIEARRRLSRLKAEAVRPETDLLTPQQQSEIAALEAEIAEINKQMSKLGRNL